MSAVLVDTNVLVYADDDTDSVKHAMALEVLSVLALLRSIRLSTQVLSEYANALTHPRKFARTAEEAIGAVRRMSAAWPVVSIDAATVIAALEAAERWKMPYYDAQIWASAARNAIPIVLSEDFPAGARLGGVRFVNPFEPGFDLESL